jgi:hypothetical protein
MVLAWVPHSRRVGCRKLRNLARLAGLEHVPIGAPSWQHYSFKDSAGPIRRISRSRHVVVLSSNPLLLLVMAGQSKAADRGFTMACVAHRPQKKHFDPLHIGKRHECSAKTIILLRAPREAACFPAAGLSAKH